MKLLVFAHTPPPVHGQSLAVHTLVEGLPGVAPEIEILHVNPRLSRHTADIGRWRPGKVLALLAACGRALALRLRHGPAYFYYVPAPAKRGALYRDWLAMALCRPFFRGVVLHWHAVGLGEWLDTRATVFERAITRWLLGRASLALVLAESVSSDARRLSPRAVQVVPGGVPDPVPGYVRPLRSGGRFEVLFLGLGSREKGLFAALEGVALARGAGLDCRLTAVGAWPDAGTEAAFRARAAELGADTVRHLGFVSETERGRLLATSDVLCFPTCYAHEGQPAVLLEALAHDLPIVTTRWRGIPEMLPTDPRIRFVAPGQPDEIATVLAHLSAAPPPDGALRAYFLQHYTRERHLARLAAALRTLQA